METGERGFGASWLTGRQHMARRVFLSVFCLCLRAPCLSQAASKRASGAAETGSLMRHSGGSEEENRGRTTGRNSTAANPCTFSSHLHNLLSLPLLLLSQHAAHVFTRTRPINQTLAIPTHSETQIVYIKRTL